MSITRFRRALVMAVVLTLSMTSLTFADEVYNNLDSSIDAAAETMAVNVGATATTTMFVNTTNGDGKNGCNIQGSTAASLVVSVNSSDTAKATVSPSSLTFDDCGDSYVVTVTGVAAGPSTISLTETSNTTAGSWNLQPATFTVNVSTAPVLDPCASVTAPAAPVFGTDGDDFNGSNGWFTSIPTVSATSSTSGATISYSTDGQNFSTTAPTLGQGTTTVTARATSATCSMTSDTQTTFMVDTVDPAISDDGIASGTAGTSPWYITEVFNEFSATDATSGLGSFVTPWTVGSGTAEGSAVTIASGSVTDLAGNTAASINSAAFAIDLSNPTNVTFVGGPAADSSHYFGSVPAAPTCTADDAISGPPTCVVTEYSSAVGTHTLTAKATDGAGRWTTATRQYTVLAWTLSGFYAPVDMGIVNTVKGGATVPLKFEIFAGSTELTNTSAIKSFTVTKTGCAPDALTDDIEIYSTGGTSLRYDTTGGQFIQNWQTPKGAGICYRVVMTTQDLSTLVATFQTK